MILDAFEDAGKSVTVGEDMLKNVYDYTGSELTQVMNLYRDMASKNGETHYLMKGLNEKIFDRYY